MNNNMKNLLSPPKTTHQISTTNKESQALPQKVLSDLFTKEFLNNVKNELNKTKSPRNKEYRDISQFTQLSQYKVEIQSLRKQLKELTIENEELKQRLGDVKNNESFQLPIQREKSSQFSYDGVKNRLKISSQVSLMIVLQNEDNIVDKLKEKIENLQMYKNIKEKRFEELLQKSARYESQIMLLKVKQQDLEEEIKSLRQTIRIQVTDMNGKPIRTTNISESNEDGKSAYGFNGVKLPFQKKQVDEIVKHMLRLNKKNSDAILMSQCNDVSVPDDYHISKMHLKNSLGKLEEFNQIDYLIEQELPYLQVSEQLKLAFKQNGIAAQKKVMEKLNDLGGSIQQSQLFIDSNHVSEKKELEQSLIKIELNHPVPPPSQAQQDKQIHKERQNKLNESLIAINLNDF